MRRTHPTGWRSSKRRCCLCRKRVRGSYGFLTMGHQNPCHRLSLQVHSIRHRSVHASLQEPDRVDRQRRTSYTDDRYVRRCRNGTRPPPGLRWHRSTLRRCVPRVSDRHCDTCQLRGSPASRPACRWSDCLPQHCSSCNRQAAASTQTASLCHVSLYYPVSKASSFLYHTMKSQSSQTLNPKQHEKNRGHSFGMRSVRWIGDP